MSQFKRYWKSGIKDGSIRSDIEEERDRIQEEDEGSPTQKSTLIPGGDARKILDLYHHGVFISELSKEFGYSREDIEELISEDAKS